MLNNPALPTPALLTAELLKFKRNPLALSLSAVTLLFPLLLWVFSRSNPDVQFTSSMPAWLLAAHAVIGLLLPYLLTLEDTLGTPRWLHVTPTPPAVVMFTKVTLVLGLALLSVLVSVPLLAETLPPLQALAFAFLGLLSSALTMTFFSLLTRSFVVTLVLSMVWLQVAGPLMTVLPEGVRDVLGAMLPGMALTHFSDFNTLWPRLIAHAVLGLGVWSVLKRRAPRW